MPSKINRKGRKGRKDRNMSLRTLRSLRLNKTGGFKCITPIKIEFDK